MNIGRLLRDAMGDEPPLIAALLITSNFVHRSLVFTPLETDNDHMATKQLSTRFMLVVREEFRFLESLHFRCVRTREHEVEYESSAVFVKVYYSYMEYCTSTKVGLIGEHQDFNGYDLHYLRHHGGVPYDAAFVQGKGNVDDDTLIAGVRENAEALRQYGGRALAGDREYWRALERTARRVNSEYAVQFTEAAIWRKFKRSVRRCLERVILGY